MVVDYSRAYTYGLLARSRYLRHLLQAHCLSRSLFNAIAIYLITEAHCGLNLPWMPANVIPFGLLAGPVAHDLHHQRGGHNFQKFFTYHFYWTWLID